MSFLDQTIILVYLCVLIGFGFFLRRKATQGIENYFLIPIHMVIHSSTRAGLFGMVFGVCCVGLYFSRSGSRSRWNRTKKKEHCPYGR